MDFENTYHLIQLARPTQYKLEIKIGLQFILNLHRKHFKDGN